MDAQASTNLSEHHRRMTQLEAEVFRLQGLLSQTQQRLATTTITSTTSPPPMEGSGGVLDQHQVAPIPPMPAPSRPLATTFPSSMLRGESPPSMNAAPYRQSGGGAISTSPSAPTSLPIFRGEVAQLQQMNMYLADELSRARAGQAEALKEANTARLEANTCEMERIRLSQQTRRLEEELVAARKERDGLRHLLGEIQSRLQQGEEEAERVSRAVEAAEDLEKENKELKRRVESQEKEKEDMKLHISKLDRYLVNLAADLDVAKEGKQRLTVELKAVKEEREHLGIQLQEMASEVKALTKPVQRAQSTRQAFDKTWETLQSLLDQFKQRVDAAKPDEICHRLESIRSQGPNLAFSPVSRGSSLGAMDMEHDLLAMAMELRVKCMDIQGGVQAIGVQLLDEIGGGGRESGFLKDDLEEIVTRVKRITRLGASPSPAPGVEGTVAAKASSSVADKLDLVEESGDETVHMLRDMVRSRRSHIHGLLKDTQQQHADLVVENEKLAKEGRTLQAMLREANELKRRLEEENVRLQSHVSGLSQDKAVLQERVTRQEEEGANIQKMLRELEGKGLHDGKSLVHMHGINTELEAALAQEKQRVASLMDSLTEHQQQSGALRTTVSELQREKQELSERLTRSENELRIIKHLRSEVAQTLERTQIEVVTLRGRLQEEERSRVSEVRSIGEQCARLREEAEDLQARLVEATGIADDAERRSQQEELENGLLQAQVQELRHRAHTQEIRRQRQMESAAMLSMAVRRSFFARRVLLSWFYAAREAGHRRHELSFWCRLYVSSKRLRSAKQAQENLRQQVKQLEAQKLSVESKARASHEKVLALMQEAEEWKDSHHELEAQVSGLRQALQEREKEVLEVQRLRESEVAAMKEELEHRESHHQQAKEELEVALEWRRTDAENMHREIARLQAEREQLSAQIVMVKEEGEILRCQEREAQEQMMKELAVRAEELHEERLKAELDKQEEQMHQWELKEAVAQSALRRTQRDLDMRTEELREVQDQLSAANQAHEMLKEEVSRLHDDLQAAEARVAAEHALQNQLKDELEKSAKERDDVDDEWRRAKEEYKRLAQELGDKDEELRESEKRVAAAKESWRPMKEELDLLHERLRDTEKHLAEAYEVRRETEGRLEKETGNACDAEGREEAFTGRNDKAAMADDLLHGIGESSMTDGWMQRELARRNAELERAKDQIAALMREKEDRARSGKGNLLVRAPSSSSSLVADSPVTPRSPDFLEAAMLRSPQVSREPVKTSPALPRTVEGLTAMLNQYGHDKKELTQQLIEAKAEISRLSHELDMTVEVLRNEGLDRHGDARVSVNDLENELHDAHVEVERLQEQVENLKDLQRASEGQLQVAGVEIRQLLSERATEMAEWLDQSHEGGVGGLREAVEEAQLKLEMKMDEVKKMEEEVARVVSELGKVKRTRNELEQTVKLQDEELALLRSRCEVYERDVGDLKDGINAKTAELQDCEARLMTQDATRRELEMQLAIVSEEADLLRQAASSPVGEVEDTERLRQENEELRAALEQARQGMEQVQDEVGRINAETRTADDDLAEGDGEGMEELRTLRQALETLEGERVSLMDKLHEVVGEKEELVRMCQLVVKVTDQGTGEDVSAIHPHEGGRSKPVMRDQGVQTLPSPSVLEGTSVEELREELSKAREELQTVRAEVWQERQMRQAVIEEKERALATREDGLAQALREKDAASRRAQSLEEALRKSQERIDLLLGENAWMKEGISVLEHGVTGRHRDGGSSGDANETNPSFSLKYHHRPVSPPLPPPPPTSKASFTSKKKPPVITPKPNQEDATVGVPQHTSSHGKRRSRSSHRRDERDYESSPSYAEEGGSNNSPSLLISISESSSSTSPSRDDDEEWNEVSPGKTIARQEILRMLRTAEMEMSAAADRQALVDPGLEDYVKELQEALRRLDAMQHQSLV